MKRFLSALLLACLLLLASVAQAEKTKLWIASGLSGGTYRSVYAMNLAKLMRDYDTLHQSTSGSGQNLEYLAAGKVDIAFSQADVYAARLASDPARYGDLLVIGKLADECVYIAHRTAGPVKNLEALGNSVEGRPARIAVGAAGGGMSGTWSYLTLLDPNLSGAEVVEEGGTQRGRLGHRSEQPRSQDAASRRGEQGACTHELERPQTGCSTSRRDARLQHAHSQAL